MAKKRMTTGTTPKPPWHDHDRDYALLLKAVGDYFDRAPGQRYFTTDADNLYKVYLRHIDEKERQVHTCNACRRFLDQFGSLVTIEPNGKLRSPFWSGLAGKVPEFYRESVAAMNSAAEHADVTGVFVSNELVWGTPKTGAWTHFAVSSPAIHAKVGTTAGQAMAAHRHNFETVKRAMQDFTEPALQLALRVLKDGKLDRSDKFVGPVQWLLDLRHALDGAKKQPKFIRDRLIWRAIASAPEGYCHPRASVVGTLLADVETGYSFDVIKKRFNEKVAPLAYQRPQAAPAAGNIAAGEILVQNLGIERSLERQFATLEDVAVLANFWTPRAPDRPSTNMGVFAGLRPKNKPAMFDFAPGSRTMTWAKFALDVLPEAISIEAKVGASVEAFIALTTACHYDAPVIFKWGHHIAWYVYPGGSHAVQWHVEPGWNKVTAVVPLPPMLGPAPKPYIGNGVVLTLDKCVDKHDGGNALFPECLISELYPIRSTIEAFSKRAKLHGRDKATACGLDLRGGSGERFRPRDLRVTFANGMRAEYKIDRWD